MTVPLLWADITRLKLDAPPSNAKKAELLKVVLEGRERLGIMQDDQGHPGRTRKSKRQALEDYQDADQLKQNQDSSPIESSEGNNGGESTGKRLDSVESAMTKVISQLAVCDHLLIFFNKVRTYFLTLLKNIRIRYVIC